VKNSFDDFIFQATRSIKVRHLKTQDRQIRTDKQ